MNNKIENAKRRIKRILISYLDISDAQIYASHLLRHKYHGDYLNTLVDSDEEYVDFLGSDEFQNMKALTTALIVSYSRPFTRNEAKESAIPSLPNRFLKSYDSFEMDLHNKILNLRNKAFAHSDADLFKIDLSISEDNEKVYLSPRYHECPEELFTQDELKLFQRMVDKLLDASRKHLHDIAYHHGKSIAGNLH
jgi:hypothetical protein